MTCTKPVSLIFILSILALYSCQQDFTEKELLETSFNRPVENQSPAYSEFDDARSEQSSFHKFAGTGSNFSFTWGFTKGINIRSAFYKKNHPVGATEADVIARVVAVLDTLNAESIRIGGLVSFGGSFDENYMGYGWSKYSHHTEVADAHPSDHHANAPWNYNIMALKAAAAANISVWINTHRYMDAGEILILRTLIDSFGVTIEGVTRANEPYDKARADNMREAYEELASAHFGSTWWPGMFIGPSSPGRFKRVDTCIVLLNEHKSFHEGIELHTYYPKYMLGGIKTPSVYISQVLADSWAAYGTYKFIIGEWAGKNPDTFLPEDRALVISEYLPVLKAYDLKCYYQFLGSDTDDRGLWNFKTNSPNAGFTEFSTFD